MQLDEYRKVSDAVMELYEELREDSKSSEMIKAVDRNPKDYVLKDFLTRGVARLREMGKNKVADAIVDKSREFAFSN
jgi:hypothetical protein